MKKLLSVLFLVMIITPHLASADSVLRIGSDVSIDESQTVEGNYYAGTRFWERITMSGSVAGDMYAAGGTVTINGEIDEDLFIVSGVSNVHATVTDDVRVVAGEVTIGEYVGGDLFVIGGTLTVLSSAHIAGTVFFFGGDGVIDGTVEQSVVGYAERLRINGTVGKDVEVTSVAGLQLGANAAIAGSVRYKSMVELVRDPNSVVSGEVTKQATAEVSGKDALRAALTPLFIILFTALSLYLFFRNHIQRVVLTIFTHPVRSVLVGTGVMLATPLVSMLLVVTVLGAILGVLVFISATILFMLGLVLAGTLVGSYVWKLYTKELTVSLWTILGGTVFTYGLISVPVIGIAFYFLLIVLIVGGSTVRLYQLLQ